MRNIKERLWIDDDESKERETCRDLCSWVKIFFWGVDVVLKVAELLFPRTVVDGILCTFVTGVRARGARVLYGDATWHSPAIVA